VAMTTAGFVPRTGQMLGRYELLLPVANGGMAEVWAARLPNTRGFRKIVAIKTILRMTVADQRFERMFIQEAKLAAQIHHPNVVETIEFAEHHGKLYLVMEYVEGETLGSIIVRANQHGGLPTSVAINVIGQVCKGLHSAHDLCDDDGNPLGLVHRDVSPQNLIVSYTGTAKVLDFGVAKATLRMTNLTEAGQLKGKFAYMSPEQLNGQTMDRRSDVFSIGVILYMLTTGRHPFKGENTDETLRNICSSRPVPPPETLVPNFSPKLAAVLHAALRKKPEERMGSALELVAALEQAHPECFDTSFETKLAGFMRDLFEERMQERRALLRAAEEKCNRKDGAAPQTPAVDEEASATAQPAALEPPHESPVPESEPGDPPGASLHAWTPPRSRAVWFFAAVAAFGIAAITLIGRHAVRAPVTQRTLTSVTVSAASTPSAAGGSASISPVPARVSEPPPAASEAAESSTKPVSTFERVGALPARPAPRSTPPPRRVLAAPAKAPVLAPAPASTQAPAPANASPAPVRKASVPATRKAPVDPWDPSTYGGRF
jgi:serine/threonine-protein kinase